MSPFVFFFFISLKRGFILITHFISHFLSSFPSLHFLHTTQLSNHSLFIVFSFAFKPRSNTIITHFISSYESNHFLLHCGLCVFFSHFFLSIFDVRSNLYTVKIKIKIKIIIKTGINLLFEFKTFLKMHLFW